MRKKFNHNQKIINEIFAGGLSLSSLLNENEEEKKEAGKGIVYKSGSGGYEYGYNKSTDELYITKSPKSKASREKPVAVSKDSYIAILKDVAFGSSESGNSSKSGKPDRPDKSDSISALKPFWTMTAKSKSQSILDLSSSDHIDVDKLKRFVLNTGGDNFEVDFHKFMNMSKDSQSFESTGNLTFKIGNYKNLDKIDEATISVVNPDKIFKFPFRGDLVNMAKDFQGAGVKLGDLRRKKVGKHGYLIEYKSTTPYGLKPQQLFRIALYCIAVKLRVDDEVITESFSQHNGMILGESRASLYRRRYHGRY